MTHPTDPKSLAASLRASIAAGSAGLKPSSRRQLVDLVLDTSSSLSGSPMDELNAGAQAFIREFARAEQRDVFEVGVITFASDVKEVVAPQHPGELVLPSFAAHGNTALGPALALAHDVVRRTLGQPKRLRPVIVVFTDGEPNVGGDPIPAALQLKRDADVIAIGLGNVNKATLEGIATSPQHVCYAGDPTQLRHLFATVGATLSKSKASLGGAAPLPGSVGMPVVSIDPFASRRR